MMVELSSKQDWESLLDSVDTVLLDCDGVLWTGLETVVPGAQDVVKFLRQKGKTVCFVSNNSSKSRKQYLEKFKKLSFEAQESEIFNSGYVGAYYLKHFAKFDGRVYVLGGSGLQQEVELLDLAYSSSSEDQVPPKDAIEVVNTEIEQDIGAVVVGYDAGFNLRMVTKACSYLKNPDCVFVGTNEDSCLPIKSPLLVPGTGCIVKCVSYAIGREPTVVGKPHKPMFEVIRKRVNLEPSRTLMVGDRPNTDIKFGRTNGMKTLLVLTGIANREDIPKLPEDCRPDFLADSIGEMLSCRT